MQGFLEEVMGEEMVLDGTIAQDSAQIAGIWGIREGISVALKHAGASLLWKHYPHAHLQVTWQAPNVRHGEPVPVSLLPHNQRHVAGCTWLLQWVDSGRPRSSDMCMYLPS